MFKPRESAQLILQKRVMVPKKNVITDCYKFFTDFISKTQSLKLVGWSFAFTGECASFASNGDIHSISKYEIYVRSPNCFISIPQYSEKWFDCVKSESKESWSLKHKREKLTSPAKLKTPISLTSLARVLNTPKTHRLGSKEYRLE